ncbi:MAG: class I SAM-dependent methyltransferase [Verrucomicrobia bacterium]|nr:class I SAM-dependent methyltransferase [Verrucomicrobiota bacterium]MBV8485404.1 class I SAM-dependent methyltransferase [Verrucomicrobiota bacterium]
MESIRSTNADIFNHDNEATDYDNDVRNEADPIRTGYQDLLRWVVQQARITPRSRVLELGSGTGNLSELITSCGELVSVDVSENMEAIATRKVRHLTNRRFIKADILEVFSQELGKFDAVISTYAVHHLTDQEKQRLFALVFERLLPSGAAVFGDLMVQNSSEKKEKIQQYLAKGDRATAQSISEEFFWALDKAIADLMRLGFKVTSERFSDLSYGVIARKATSLARAD